MNTKFFKILSWVATFTAMLMYISYIPQIIANLKGNKSQPLQPLTAAISCLIWVIYGLTKDPKKDYLLIIPNATGVVLGLITFFTA